jgi:hypothetical protein
VPERMMPRRRINAAADHCHGAVTLESSNDFPATSLYRSQAAHMRDRFDKQRSAA